MIKTEHGFWPCHHLGSMRELEYFRHSRVSLVVNGVGGVNQHVISVAVVSFQKAGEPPQTVGSIVQQGGDYFTVKDAPFSTADEDEVQPDNFVDWEDFTGREQKFLLDQGNPHAADARHELMCEKVWGALEQGLIRKKATPPKPEYAPFAW